MFMVVKDILHATRGGTEALIQLQTLWFAMMIYYTSMIH